EQGAVRADEGGARQDRRRPGARRAHDRRPPPRDGIAVPKRSLTLAGHRTSVSLEEPFWAALAEIAETEGMSVAALIARVDSGRPNDTNLSAAIRLFVLDWYRKRSRAAGIT